MTRSRILFRAGLVCLWLSATGCQRVSDSGGAAFDEATTALRQGQLARASRIAEENAQSGTDVPDASSWRFRLLRAEIALARLDRPAADALLADPVPPGDAFNDARARRLYLQARAAVDRGQLEPALELLQAAAASLHADRTVDIDAEILGGQIRMRLGRWSEGETRLQAVVDETARRGDAYRQALALINMGMGQVIRVRCDAALAWFERALALAEIEATSAYALALNNAGICYARLGEFDRAVAVQRRAVAQHERTDRLRELQQSLGELGSTYLTQEDFDQGLPYLQRALRIASDAGLTADAALWARNLSAAYVHLARWDEADKYNAEARRLNPADRPGKGAYDTLHAGHIAAGRGHLEDAERQLAEALATAKDDPAIQWSAHDGLARIAARRNQPALSRRHFEDALGIIDATRSDLLKTDYRLSFLTRLIGFYRGYVNALVDQGQIERALEVADSSRGRLLAELQSVAAPPTRPGVASLQRLARRSRSVLLSYWLGAGRSHLWVVTGDRVERVSLPAAGDIEVLVREHQRAIESATADVLAAADTAGDRRGSGTGDWGSGIATTAQRGARDHLGLPKRRRPRVLRRRPGRVRLGVPARRITPRGRGVVGRGRQVDGDADGSSL